MEAITRNLQDELLMNTTSTSSDTQNALRLDDAAGSWVPIFSVFLLTLFQIGVFLSIFEVARRSTKLGFVYDKKRRLRPGRTPPPLMHRVFEWWSLRLSDPAYNEQATQQARARNTQDAPKQDSILDQAVKECYDKVSNNAEILDIDIDGSTRNIPSSGEPVEETKQPEEVELGLIQPLKEDKELLDTDDDETKGTSNMSSVSGTTTGAITPRSARKRISAVYNLRKRDASHSRTDSLSVSSTARRRHRALSSNGSSSRRLSTLEEPSAVQERRGSVDPLLGSAEAERLARLRYDEEDVKSAWDQEAVSRFIAFLKRRVLQLREDKNDKKRSSPEYLFHKVVRRKLTREDQELLRCIGVDAFMTLRFLKFGFDAFFWPFLFALVTLIPAFLSGQNDDVARAGFFGCTVLGLENGDAQLWFVVLFGYVHFIYILRRIWIEWEIFLPVRFDFLQNGDFVKEKYQMQYRHTCVVEYVPKDLCHDKDLYKFFDSIFPGQVRRAEVLLNTEFLRALIAERLKHITMFEDTFAKMVHEWAQYLRLKQSFEESGPISTLCKTIVRPTEPKERKIVVVHKVPCEDMGNRFLKPQTAFVRDAKTYPALQWHTHRIKVLNKEIEDEYLRLAIAQRRPVPPRKEGWLAKKLGFDMMKSVETGRVHSTTAFVEFRSVTAKQQAIQCNLTGLHRYLQVFPCPEIREVRWENMHVSLSVIETRKWWANVFLLGCLIAWSFVVAAIRSVEDLSDILNIENELLRVLFDFYVPAMLVEGLVRSLPFAIKFLATWIRFKASSAIDHYVVKWYIGFRSVTFVFVIIGGTLVESGTDLVDDPLGFFKNLSDNVAENSQFFTTYVMVAGTLQCFFRLSQVHNMLLQWLLSRTTIEEATSHRRLEKSRTTVPGFHMDEFIPLFLFIFMVGALYGPLAPVASLFAAAFFLVSYRVFRFLALFVYGNEYEGGGFIFYTLNSVIFYVLYVFVLVLVGYLGKHGRPAMAGLFFLMLFVVLSVHIDIHRTFVLHSMSLSLAKAKHDDDRGRSSKELKFDAYMRAKTAFEECEGDDDSDVRQKFLDESSLSATERSLSTADPSTVTPSDTTTGSMSERKRQAVERMDRRYEKGDSLSDFTDSDASGPGNDFFIYRQPSLNRATWEIAPRPYRENSQILDVSRFAEVWR